jgi:phospholipid-binding lipoprotein MlaA
MKQFRGVAGTLALAVGIVGCASTGNPQDPFEGYNRAMFTVNRKLDDVALKPAAKAYRTVTPSFAQVGVSNFFGNLADVWTAINNLLQGKIDDGLSDVGRVSFNSTIGLVGLIDVASVFGMPKHKEDFGQTLGRWGVKSGPYVVLPFFGSSTVRDTFALPLDLKGNIWQYKDPVRWRNVGTGLRLVDQRAALLDASNLLEDVALDPYEFVRDAYLQRRESSIHDGGGFSGDRD